MPADHTHSITKRLFQAHLRCDTLGWLVAHEPSAPELEPSVGERLRMRQGGEIGAFARGYFPGGHLIERGGRSVEAMLAETADALGGDAPAVYEAAFVLDDVLLFTDILVRTGASWTLVEVKSATSCSDDHILDAAFQTFVLRALGVDVSRVDVMHLNRECRYPDLSTLFVREDVTERVDVVLPTIDADLPRLRATLAGAMPPAAIGDQCTKPAECAFKDRCWPVLPRHHVSTLYRVQKKKVAEYVSAGYHVIPDLPDTLKLSTINARQRRAVLGDSVVVEREALTAALAQLSAPVAHLDFETVALPIPRWPGCRPYDQVPVQMSCHVVGTDGAVTHHDWIADGPGDPRAAIARAVLDACRGANTVTAYFASFEQGRLRELADACPEMADALRAVADAIVDLLPLVRDHVYHPEFFGSFSLKKVLPALVPALHYGDLEVQEGETASAELLRLMFESAELADEERSTLRQALLAYCERDTEAMVALADRLVVLSQA